MLEVETINRTIAPPKKYRAKIKKLRKEQQRLQKTVKRLRRKIKEKSMGKVPDKPPKTVNTEVQTKLYESRATGTQTEPILTQPVKEQYAILPKVAT